MRKNFKRWVALLLAVVMTASTCLYSQDGFLRATDGTEQTTEDMEAAAIANALAGTDGAASGPVETTQELQIPAQPAAEEPAAEEPSAPPAEETLPPAEGPAEEMPAEEPQTVYDVTFYRQPAEGGTVRVWTDGSAKQDVTLTDGNYTAGTVLFFEVEAAGNYFVDHVSEASGGINQISVNGNVSTYSIVVDGNKEITVVYGEVPAVEEPKEDAPAVSGDDKDKLKEDKPQKEEVKDEGSEEEETKDEISEKGEQKEEASDKEEAPKKEETENESSGNKGESDNEASKNKTESNSGASEEKKAEKTKETDEKNTILDSIGSFLKGNANEKDSPALLDITDDNGNKEQVTIAIGETITLTDSDGANAQGGNTWECNPQGIVTVEKDTSNGKKAAVTGISEGKAVITHSWTTGMLWWTENHKTSFTVIVEDVKAEEIIVNSKSENNIDSLNMKTNEEITLTASIKPDNTVNKEVKWISSDSEVVTVEDGKVIARKAGTAEITVTAEDGSETSKTIKVTVSDVKVERIQVTSLSNSKNVNIEGTLLLKAEVLPEDATNKAVTWESADEKIATVDENGLVTGVSEGEVTIQAKSAEDESIVGEITLTVKQAMMTGFHVSADRTKVTVGDPVKVSAIIQPEDYENKGVTWTSSDEKIAVVDQDGNVTTKAKGTVTITGVAQDNKKFSGSVTIQVEDVKASKVTITGNNKTFLVAGVGTLDLRADVEPEDAVDKTIVWTSYNEDVATVDQDGHVTALKQGTTVIRAENVASGAYDEITVQVYDSAPQDIEIGVWVTNQYQNASVSIHVPSDGTSVDPSSAVSDIFTNGDKRYKFTGVIRCSTLTGNQPKWGELSKQPLVGQLRYNTEMHYVEYTSGDGNWKRVAQNEGARLCAFYESLRGATDDGSNVEVIVGDWPYGDNESTGETKQTIQILVINDETGETKYDSGVMRYSDGSDGYYGKIKFGCDTSRYEVDYATVQKGNGELNEIKNIPPEGISVQFEDGKENHYVITAHIKAKLFDVSYDANGGEGSIPQTEHMKAIDGQTVTVASSPKPTLEGYIFAGWEYAGTTYWGGETFEMPPNDIVFRAKWIQKNQVINYTVNNPAMGTITRDMDIINNSTTEVVGSVANPNPGYRFVGWYEGNVEVTKESHLQPVGDQIKATTYEARFEQSSYIITATVINGLISPEGEVSVGYNEDKTFTYLASEGYILDSVEVDGQQVNNEKSYTFENVKEDHTITVTYKRDTEL